MVLMYFKTESGSDYIYVMVKCGSYSPYLLDMALFWQSIIIICWTALAFKTCIIGLQQVFGSSHYDVL